jgi:hypothetical protein
MGGRLGRRIETGLCYVEARLRKLSKQRLALTIEL